MPELPSTKSLTEELAALQVDDSRIRQYHEEYYRGFRSAVDAMRPIAARHDKLLAMATSFHVWSLPDSFSYRIDVESRGNDKWVVKRGGFVYSTAVRWFVYEPQPSSREDDFIAETRFSRDEAFRIAFDWAAKFQAAYDASGGDLRKFVREVQPDKFGVVFTPEAK
jgi:hypothetical protein